PGAGPGEHLRVPGSVLQPGPPALVTGVLVSGRVQADPQPETPVTSTPFFLGKTNPRHRFNVGKPGETEAGSAWTQPCRGRAGPTLRRWPPARAPVGSCYRVRVFPARPLRDAMVWASTGV